LIIAPPGRKAAGRRIAALLPLADLFPTVLELLGVPPPPDHPARSFAAALGGAVVASRPCYGETMLPYQGYGWSPLWSYTTPEWKYIRTPEPELYDRRTDPRELRNLAGEQAAKLAELDSQLTAMQAGMRPAAAAAVTLSAADKRQLQSLGYTAGGSADAGPADYRKLRDIKEMIAIPDMYGMMMTAFRQRDFGERTQALCEELIRLSPETATFHNDLGTIWVNRGDFQRAERRWRAILDSWMCTIIWGLPWPGRDGFRKQSPNMKRRWRSSRKRARCWPTWRSHTTIMAMPWAARGISPAPWNVSTSRWR
jgi:hypothetical protein